jgi:hypothetical protein
MVKNMNVVIQNDCQHALTRKEVESMSTVFPAKWGKNVKTIALYQGKEPEIEIKYYPKEQMLGVFSPKENKDNKTKTQVVQEMLIGLEWIAENDNLPRNFSKSVRTSLREKTALIREECLRLVTRDTT